MCGKELDRTEGPPRTGHGRRETKLGPGPPDPSLDGLRAAVIDDCEEAKTRSIIHCTNVNKDDERSSAPTPSCARAS